MMPATPRPPLARLLWRSVAAALATIALKTLAWVLTGSVGLLSDAAESLVNLAAALFALVIVHWAARPPDEEHPYGHEKADYLSAGARASSSCSPPSPSPSRRRAGSWTRSRSATSGSA
jgi:divalent metal cation (Fe/Co/Zn/Cd) transporter